MRTYYRDDHLCITSTAIWVDERGYPLREVDHAWRGDAGFAGRRLLAELGLLVLFGTIALALALAFLGDGRRWWTGWWHGGLVALAAVCLVGLALAVVKVLLLERVLSGFERLRDRRYRELWVIVRGEPVCVLRTTDGLHFGKARRALIRALSDRSGLG